jgi:hypothetical protein
LRNKLKKYYQIFLAKVVSNRAKITPAILQEDINIETRLQELRNITSSLNEELLNTSNYNDTNNNNNNSQFKSTTTSSLFMPNSNNDTDADIIDNQDHNDNNMITSNINKSKSNTSFNMTLRDKRNRKREINMMTSTKATHSGLKQGDEAMSIIRNLPVLDTGATDHATNIRPTRAVNIRSSNGTSMYLGGDPSKPVEETEICDSGFLKDIMVCPNMKRSLISLSLLMQQPYVNINYNNRCYVYDTSKPGIPLILSGTRYHETRLPMADIVINGPTYHELLRMLSQPNSLGDVNAATRPALSHTGANDGKSQGCEMLKNATIEQPQPRNYDDNHYKKSEDIFPNSEKDQMREPLLYPNNEKEYKVEIVNPNQDQQQPHDDNANDWPPPTAPIIDNCSTHLKPLQQMVTEATKIYGNKKSKSNKLVQWNQEREAAFRKVQQLANECPTLFFLTETGENRLWDWGIFVSEERGWLRTTYSVHE